MDSFHDEINALMGANVDKSEQIDAEIDKNGIKLRDFGKFLSSEPFCHKNTTNLLTASRHAKRALLIGLTIVIYNQFSGCFAMLNYTATIFEKAGSSMSPNNSAIIVGSIQILGNYCATMTVERLGRKVKITCKYIYKISPH